MLIHDMTRDKCLELLEDTHIGRIACAQDNQPYITPFSFVYHDDFIYGFGTVGKRIDWMRANPRVCVEIEKIVNHREWQTVVVSGHYEELPDTSEFYQLRIAAHDLLSRFPNWWEPGYARTIHLETSRKLEPIYFRIAIDEISGHQAFPQS